MEIRDRIIDAAARLFDEGGFEATGVDRLTSAAGVSSRTFYKHIGSKAALIGEVLSARDVRYRAALEVDSVAGLFVVLERWLATEGTRGCLFLRALGESGGADERVARVVTTHRDAVRGIVRQLVSAQLGGSDDDVADQIHVLLEGATAAAVQLGPTSARTAARAAVAVMDAARTRRS